MSNIFTWLLKDKNYKLEVNNKTMEKKHISSISGKSFSRLAEEQQRQMQEILRKQRNGH